jgi:hypothetical protein
MRRRGPEIGRARSFERGHALEWSQVPSSGVQPRRSRPYQHGEDAASAAPTLRVALPAPRDSAPRPLTLGEAWEERVAEQSSIRRQKRRATILPSVIVEPEPPPPPLSIRPAIDPAAARERLERMAPTQLQPRTDAAMTTRSTAMASVKPATVIVLFVFSIVVFAVGVTTLLLATQTI